MAVKKSFFHKNKRKRYLYCITADYVHKVELVNSKRIDIIRQLFS